MDVKIYVCDAAPTAFGPRGVARPEAVFHPCSSVEVTPKVSELEATKMNF